MDLPPQQPHTTATMRAHGSEIGTPTRPLPKRMGKQPAPHLTNDVPKRHKLPPPYAIVYGKCNKNYAASTGGVVLDGCGEFMPSPTPSSLQCSVCGCHRSFHRSEADNLHQPVQQVIECQCQHQHQHRQPPPTPPSCCLAGMAKSSSTPDSQSPPPISSSYYPQHMFFSINPSLPPQEPANNNHPPILTPAVPTGSNPKGKKRFRSKFSEHQKAKMQEFAEKIGWKMLKTEEEMIVGFCNHIGVTKAAFKVWMHNHKAASNSGNRRNNHPNNNGNTIGANGSPTSS